MTQVSFNRTDTGIQKFLPGDRVVKKKDGKPFANGALAVTVVRYDDVNPRMVWLDDGGPKIGTRSLKLAQETPVSAPVTPPAILSVKVSYDSVRAVLTAYVKDILNIDASVATLVDTDDNSIELVFAS
ncbi:hypothetical protein GOC60_04650 [Sinorhizobium meliloti]|nr:hypothetical protein [Sinorhizobium meliloti]MDX0347806.1 hypothetical protein [Sinorhizobium meliloti]